MSNSDAHQYGFGCGRRARQQSAAECPLILTRLRVSLLGCTTIPIPDFDIRVNFPHGTIGAYGDCRPSPSRYAAR
jgi:hypothetical protein